MPNNKKQRGRGEKKKRNQAQQQAKKVVDEQQAQRKAEEARRAELAAKTLLRAQMEAALRRRFETWAIDEVITDMSRSLSTTTTITTVAGAATASKPASSSSSTAEKPEEKVVCYHSSSAEHFVADSEFLQMVKSYVSLGKKYYFDAEHDDVRTNFVNEEDHDKVLLDSEFTNFVFAVAVELYFKSSSEERERYYTCTMAERPSTTIYELQTIIRFGLQIKYLFDPHDTQSLQEQFNNRANGKKYIKDIDTERGLINCLHRETTLYCNCMDSKKEEAKGMEKMERCRKCRNEFPKTLMKKCDRCESVVYCSIECCKDHWCYHQIECENRQKKLAAITMNHIDDDSDGGDDNEFDMNLFRDDDETLGDTTAVAPSSSSHSTNNAMTNANANTNTFAKSITNPPAAVPADENMINRAINNSVEGKKNANGGAVDGAGGGDDDDDDDDGDDERFARGIRSGGPFDFQSLVLDAKNAREEEPATSKGIIHGTCDGSGNIGSCGHEKGGEIMTTKKVEAKALPPHTQNTTSNQNDNTDGPSTRKEASIFMEGGSTEFLAATAAAVAVAVTVPCKTPHPPSELHANNDGVLNTNNNNNNINNNQH